MPFYYVDEAVHVISRFDIHADEDAQASRKPRRAWPTATSRSGVSIERLPTSNVRSGSRSSPGSIIFWI